MHFHQKTSALMLILVMTSIIPTAWAHDVAESWFDDDGYPQSMPWAGGMSMQQQGWAYSAPAYPYAGPGHHRGSFHGLNLSRDQNKQINKIFREARSAMHRIHDQMSDKRQALYALLEDSYNQQAVQQLADQIGKLTAERIVLRSDTHAQIKAILTPEQQEKFDQRMLGHF